MEFIFTRHVLERLEKRKISREEAIDCAQFPDSVHKKHGKHYFQKKTARGTIEAVCEKKDYIKIITVYWV